MESFKESSAPGTTSASTSTSPNAICFGGDLPAAGMPCRVEVTRVGLRLLLSEPVDGMSTDETVPFAGMSVEAGGFDHDQLVVTWPHQGNSRTLYLKDPSLIASFRRTAPPELIPHLERTAGKVRRVRLGRRTLLAIALGAPLALVVTLWLGSDALVHNGGQPHPR